MLVIEIPRSNTELITEVKEAFDDCKILEVDSLGADTIIQILIPTITVGVPAASAIIIQVLKSAKTSVKYNNIEVNGSPQNIAKVIETIKRTETINNGSAISSEG